MDISIIIPAKNAEKYLDRCLKSLSEALTVARNVKSEVLVIDNGSDDKTLMLARKWREKASLGAVHIRYGAGPWQMIFRRKWWLEQKNRFLREKPLKLRIFVRKNYYHF